MSALEQSDASLQLAFARHLRDPQTQPVPDGLDPQRVATYRRLFFNNLEGVLSANFPVICRILGDQWRPLVRRFYAEHPSAAPLFTELSREFVAYLAAMSDPPRPFLAELAHYEWVELALLLDPTELADIRPEPILELQHKIVVSPCAWLLAYRFPVYEIRADFQPDQPPAEPTFLVVYRDRSDRIGFTALNRVSARLLELLSQPDAQAVQDVVHTLARELGMPGEQLAASALRQMQQWLDRHILLGSEPIC